MIMKLDFESRGQLSPGTQTWSTDGPIDRTQSNAVPACSMLFGICLCMSVEAQTTAPYAAQATAASPQMASSAGLVNDWLREQNPALDVLDLGGQFRGRYVYQSYFAVPGAGATAVDFRANTPQDENDFLLLRTRVHAGYSPFDWLTVFGQCQNSSSTGDKRNPNPQSDGPMDLRQGYVQVSGGKELPLSLK